MSLLSKIPRLLGYDATERRSEGNRRFRRKDLRSEDKVLRPQMRDQAVSDARELRRNSALAAWAIRKHLDYVSTFHFQCRTGIAELDDRVEALMDWWQRPLNCDVTGRHNLQGLMRLWESGRTVDGDHFVLKLSDGRLQSIESDRIRTPDSVGEFTSFKKDDFVHGVQISSQGKAQRYAICDRGEAGFVLRSVVSAGHLHQLGYFERYDQVRGISPLLSALNQFNDLYEASEYALAKMKISQLFGLKMTQASDVEADDEPREVGFDFTKGPQIIELEKGEEASFLTDSNPSDQFQAFMLQGIQLAIKALDIPFSFYAENFTNYSGHRGALLAYEQSANGKRAKVRDLLNALTVWRLSLFIADGELELPEGLRLDDVAFDWIGEGLPWIDPKTEAEADVLLINNRLASREGVCRARGQNWYTLVDQQEREEKYLKDKGLATIAVAPQPATTQPKPAGEAQGGTDDNRNQAA